MPRRPSVIVFDVNETLLDITTLEPLFERVFGDGVVMRKWFAQLILYSQTCTLSGIYTPFGTLAVGAFHMVASILGVKLAEEDVQELKQRLGVIPAHADVAPALERLRSAGLRLVTLTNSAPTASPTPLESAGLAEYFEENFSVESVKKFKPAPETYQYVADAMQLKASEFCLVACHLWDTIGAQAVGWSGALVLRPDNALLTAPGVPLPHVVAKGLEEMSEKLLKL